MIWNNERLVKKSRLTPMDLAFKGTYYMIGEKYARNLLVTQLPREFSLGLLSQYAAIPHIKMQIVTERLDMDCASLLRKEFNDKKEEYKNSENDRFRLEQLSDELASMNQYVNEIINSKDMTQNVTICFTVMADGLDDLNKKTKDFKSSLQTQGFSLFSGKLMQEQLFKAASPLFTETGLPKVIEENLGVPLPSLGTAGLYPFVFETLKDKYGFILGHEHVNHGIILFDPFKWINEEDEAKKEGRKAGNIVLAGDTGSGKTTTMSLLIRYFIRKKAKIVWIDPENKNGKMIRKYGGSFINMGRKGNIINVFDLKPNSVEEDEDASVMWDTETSIYNNIDDIKIILSYLSPSISDDSLSIVGDVVIRTYAEHGITFSDSFKGMPSDRFPTFTDFDKTLNLMIEENLNMEGKEKVVSLLNDLKLKIKPILNEYSIYLNGHTTIKPSDGDRNIIGFGTKILFTKDDKIVNALTRVIYQYAWSLCLDDSELSAFILDEASTQMLEEVISKLLAQMVRRSRKYNNVCVIGTQQPRDFTDKRIITHGKAIFDNSPYRIIMHLEKGSIEDLSKLIDLNSNEMQFIESSLQGDALFICGQRHIPIHVIPTQNELKEM